MLQDPLVPSCSENCGSWVPVLKQLLDLRECSYFGTHLWYHGHSVHVLFGNQLLSGQNPWTARNRAPKEQIFSII